MSNKMSSDLHNAEVEAKKRHDSKATGGREVMTQCPHTAGLSTCPICDAERIEELEGENKALREAAQAAVDAVRYQKPEYEKESVDALAKLLEVEV